jgi:hypothetical protein
MHTRAQHSFERINLCLLLPTIVLQVFTGGGNLGFQSLFGGSVEAFRANLIFGALSLCAATLTAVTNMLHLQQNMEAHRRSAQEWGKFYRIVSVELCYRRDQRVHCHDFTKMVRAEYDRLIEHSAPIPKRIVQAFRDAFTDNHDIKKPDMCNGLEHTAVCIDPNPRDALRRRRVVTVGQEGRAWEAFNSAGGGTTSPSPLQSPSTTRHWSLPTTTETPRAPVVGGVVVDGPTVTTT